MHILQGTTSFWVKELDLNIRDKAVLEEGGMPSDKHMYATNQLLQKDLIPTPTCVQGPLLAQTEKLQPVVE